MPFGNFFLVGGHGESEIGCDPALAIVVLVGALVGVGGREFHALLWRASCGESVVVAARSIVLHAALCIDLPSHIDQLMHVIVAEVRQQGNLQQPIEGVLKEQVEENAGKHHADYIAETEFQHFVELDEEAVGKLRVDQLHHQGSDEGRLEGQFAKHPEDSTTHESFAKSEAARPEHKYDQPDSQCVATA